MNLHHLNRFHNKDTTLFCFFEVTVLNVRQERVQTMSTVTMTNTFVIDHVRYLPLTYVQRSDMSDVLLVGKQRTN